MIPRICAIFTSYSTATYSSTYLCVSSTEYFGNRFGTSGIPNSILEAIAQAMPPDIRELTLSKEG